MGACIYTCIVLYYQYYVCLVLVKVMKLQVSTSVVLGSCSTVSFTIYMTWAIYFGDIALFSSWFHTEPTGLLYPPSVVLLLNFHVYNL